MHSKISGASTSIAQASALVFAITFVSKIIAYLESAIVAAYFGTSAEIDMFYLANSISVRFVFTIFASLSIVGVTMYNNAVASGGREKGDRFVTGLLSFVIPFALLATILLCAFAPLIADVMSRNYTEAECNILCMYIRILSFVAIFYALGAVLTSVLNAKKRFIPGALCSIIQNLTLIFFIVVFSSQIRVVAVVFGCVCGYIVQGIFLYICVRRSVRLTRFSIKDDVNPKQLGLRLIPLILGDATGEVNLLVDQFISTEFGDGYVSALSYGGSLDEFVSAFFVQSISSVLLSFFSSLASEKKYDEMFVQIRRVFNTVVIILVPITIVTILCSSDIVAVVYQRGRFDTESVSMTAVALTGYGIGFVFKAIFVLIRRPFYAMENMRVPMVLSMFSVAVNIALTIVLGRAWGIFGITIATTIAFTLGDILAVIILNRTVPGKDWSGEGKFLKKLGVAGLVSGIISYLFIHVTREFCQMKWDIYAGIFSLIMFLMCTVICFTVYVVCLKMTKMREFDEIITGLYNKLIRKR